MRILYIGADFGTTKHRYLALQRLGHEVFLVDPFSFIPSNRLVNKWIYETGALGISVWIKKEVLFSIKDMQFDLCLVDGGNIICPELVKALKLRCKYVANYNNDCPFSRTQWRKWRLYRASIAQYDLLVFRVQNITEAQNWGAKKVLNVMMSADEVAHKPVVLSHADRATWSSEVCFVGTWMPERGPFMAKLLERGIPLSIWGDRWHKSKEWASLRFVWRGPGIFSTEYVKPILASKISLGLLSKENQDLHTKRSVEIPAVGGLLCAERTTEHMQMYEEGKEALFWKDADECADVCKTLLDNPERRKAIAKRGHERCLKNNYFNEPMLKKIIAHAISKE